MSAAADILHKPLSLPFPDCLTLNSILCIWHFQTFLVFSSHDDEDDQFFAIKDPLGINLLSVHQNQDPMIAPTPDFQLQSPLFSAHSPNVFQHSSKFLSHVQVDPEG